MNRLAGLSLVLLATLVAHTLDHGLNQPAREVPPSGTAIAVLGFALVAASAVLALRRSPVAPPVALLAGAATVFGIIAVHLLPGWWDFVSDPYWDFEANALTWLLAVAPLAAGALLATEGARQMARGPARA